MLGILVLNILSPGIPWLTKTKDANLTVVDWQLKSKVYLFIFTTANYNIKGEVDKEIFS